MYEKCVSYLQLKVKFTNNTFDDTTRMIITNDACVEWGFVVKLWGDCWYSFNFFSDSQTEKEWNYQLS